MQGGFARAILVAAGLVAAAAIGGGSLIASEAPKAVPRDYSLVRAAPAPRTQDPGTAEAQSAGCVSCHTDSDAHTMHTTPAVVLGCVDCHGGNPRITAPPGRLAANDPAYVAARDRDMAGAAATPCSTSKRRNSSASATRPTTGWRAKPAAPAISRS
jgi:hypothetical protein